MCVCDYYAFSLSVFFRLVFITYLWPPSCASGSRGTASSRKRAGAPGYGRFERVLRACRPTEAKTILFEVECADGTKAIVANATLRSEAPLALVDFYETRIRFAT